MTVSSVSTQIDQRFQLPDSLQYSADLTVAGQFLRDLRAVVSPRSVPLAPDVYNFHDLRESVFNLICGLESRIINADAMLNDSQKGHVVDRLRALGRQDALIKEIGLDALAALINSWSSK